MTTQNFRAPIGSIVRLKDYPTHLPDEGLKKSDARECLLNNAERLSELQEVLYAQNIYSLLVVFQAMDAAGKDGTIKYVMSGVNPQGCKVVSFKQPSVEELDHDYLWRVAKHLPERGKIGIFNRSHYEDVLAVRVHPEILEQQQLPKHIKQSNALWQDRFRQINDFERHLTDNGTVVLKFYLHVSKEEQKQRFLERLTNPEKHWKFSAGDVQARRYWGDYMKAYEEVFSNTSTQYAPWHIIPADDKWLMRVAVSDIIIAALQDLDLHYPRISKERTLELAKAKEALLAEE